LLTKNRIKKHNNQKKEDTTLSSHLPFKISNQLRVYCFLLGTGLLPYNVQANQNASFLLRNKPEIITAVQMTIALWWSYLSQAGKKLYPIVM
jgi:hypothetical protein